MPYEILNKKFRTAQKNLDREVSHLQASATELEKKLDAEEVKAKDITMLLGGMVEKLQVLKRKGTFVILFVDTVPLSIIFIHF